MEYESKNWIVEGSSDWMGVIYPEGHNWVDFTFALLTFEWDKMMGALELCVGFLGLNLRIYYIYDHDTPLRKDLKEQIDKIQGKEHAP